MNIGYMNKLLMENTMINKIEYFEKISSTNDYAKENLLSSGTLIIAEKQIKGRGKEQRVWYTDYNVNIAMTIYLKPNCNISMLETLTKEIAQQIKTFFREQYNLELAIKLPNDLFLNGKKICGILTETVIQKEIVKELIIGIGFNVNQEVMNLEISKIATSLRIETGKIYKREDIIVGICNYLQNSLLHSKILPST